MKTSMKRIMIIGNAGSGKSTFARDLAEKLKLPLFYLDKILWLPGWKKPEEDVVKEKVENIIAEDEWIIDGNFRSTIAQLAGRADTIIYLNLSTILCLYRIVKRRYSGNERTDIAEGCTEKLHVDFLKPVLFYKFRTDPEIRKVVASLPPAKRVVELKSQKAVNEFLINS
jgi:adenylate kinase family enzyme